MLFLILLNPFITFIVVGIFGFFFSRKGSSIILLISSFITFLIALLIMLDVGFYQSYIEVLFFDWVKVSVFSISLGLKFDFLSAFMIFIVTFISFLIHLYSLSYMSHDPYLTRFLLYLTFFTFFMLFFVTANNFVQMFIGWEGVGLCSYLLINFWFTRIAANKAALKAMITNRVSDVFLLFSIVLILLVFKTVDYSVCFTLLPYVNLLSLWNINILEIINFCIFIGAIGKSAQFGFHIWLPDAMEGPTPVSALLHAATMVTAGVYLLLRCSILIEYSSIISFFILLIGCITTLYAGLAAVFQTDVKKIIAYSTCSQLGYMFISLALSNYPLAFFHLINHAFFKALLFLSAGVLIHSLEDEQDIRKMGFILYYSPLLYIYFLIGSLAIMGFPFLTGFYSKDIIIEYTYVSPIINSFFVYFICLFSALLTIIYSLKILHYVFYTEPSYFKNIVYKNKEENFYLNSDSLFLYIPVIILGFLSIFMGYLWNDLFIGFGNSSSQMSFFILPENYYLISCEFISLSIKLMPFFFVLVFTPVCLFFFYWISKMIVIDDELIKFSYYLYPFSYFFHVSFLNELYLYYFSSIYNYSYNNFYKLLDKGIFEYFINMFSSKFVLFLFSNYTIILFKELEGSNIFFYIFINIFMLFIFLFSFILVFLYYYVFFCIIKLVLIIWVYYIFIQRVCVHLVD